MAKRFKLRISRVIPYFQSCRSKDPSTLPEDPVPSLPGLSPTLTLPPVTPPPCKPHRSSFKHHVSSAFSSVGCVLGSKSSALYSDDDDRTESVLEFKWEKEEKWHVIAKAHDETPRQKIYNSSVSGDSSDDLFPPLPPLTVEKKNRRSRKKKTVTRLRISTSSAESCLFSDDREDEEETETLVSSSRSFSTDSSTSVSRRPKKKKSKRAKRNSGNVSKVKIICRSSVSSAAESESPARLSMFKRLIPCAVEGKVKESFAVVKKSDDPYEDFKGSMMEMILEKQMFEERELEQLLQCFLSLNSRDHHGVIVEAFAEIWESLFSTTTTTTTTTTTHHQRVLNFQRKSV